MDRKPSFEVVLLVYQKDWFKRVYCSWLLIGMDLQLIRQLCSESIGLRRILVKALP